MTWTSPLCGLCGQTARGYATVNNRRYCHGDYDAEPTCYMLACRERAVRESRGISSPVPLEYEDDPPSYGETMAAAHREIVRWRDTLDWLAAH